MIHSTSYSSIRERFTSVHRLLTTTSYSFIVESSRNVRHVSTEVVMREKHIKETREKK
jgi:hypothetical protein